MCTKLQTLTLSTTLPVSSCPPRLQALKDMCKGQVDGATLELAITKKGVRVQPSSLYYWNGSVPRKVGVRVPLSMYLMAVLKWVIAKKGGCACTAQYMLDVCSEMNHYQGRWVCVYLKPLQLWFLHVLAFCYLTWPPIHNPPFPAFHLRDGRVFFVI